MTSAISPFGGLNPRNVTKTVKWLRGRHKITICTFDFPERGVLFVRRCGTVLIGASQLGQYHFEIIISFVFAPKSRGHSLLNALQQIKISTQIQDFSFELPINSKYFRLNVNSKVIKSLNSFDLFFPKMNWFWSINSAFRYNCTKKDIIFFLFVKRDRSYAFALSNQI